MQVVLALISLIVVLLGAGYGWISNPAHDPAPLPAGLIPLESAEGQRLRASAAAAADLEPLLGAFQTQEKRSWCGVASQAMVLTVLRGRPVTQASVFTPEAAAVRGWWRVSFGGMPLDVLGAMMTAHGLDVEVMHAESSSASAMRSRIAKNLADPSNLMLVNYSRAGLGQGDGGHISPLGAYDAGSDRVLVLDVAAYRWPPVWVELDRLFAAMNTVDGESGRTRGIVEVGRQGDTR